MSEALKIIVDGNPRVVPAGSILASVLLNLGVACFRSSVGGEARAPLCGMGICYECRVTVDGWPQVRSCMTVCRDGMTVETGESGVGRGADRGPGGPPHRAES
jgi:predicted molibdopterin-dependent oxidoreductase YjgC